MRRLRVFLFVTALAGFAPAACGGNVVVDGHSGSTSGAGAGGMTSGSTGGSLTVGSVVVGSTGAGASTTCSPIASGDCTSDADCQGGAGSCAPITPGGYRVCLTMPPSPAQTCSPPINGGMNQCCSSTDCATGGCYSTTSILSCLGGPPEPVYNECISDECEVDADCPNMGAGPEACIPANAYGYPFRSCFAAYCRTNADCTAQPCGVCAPIADPCCSLPTGLGCVYPGGCKESGDCPEGQECDLDPTTGTGTCMPSGGHSCPV